MSLTIGGRSAQHLPLVCRDHRVIAGEVDGTGVSATLTSAGSADIEVVQTVYKGSPITSRGTATVSLASAAGPTGSLEGTAATAGGPLRVSAQFRCSAAGGGVYAGRGSANASDGAEAMVLYFTVSHDGARVVDLLANTIGAGRPHPLPNVQLAATGVAVGADGRFSVTAPLVAEDPTGLLAQGRPASLEGTLDRTGGASGTVTLPGDVALDPIAWHGSVVGPAARPVFPHAPLDTPIITAETVASDPAVNQLYPGSTDLSGAPPGRPVASPEMPPEDDSLSGPFAFASWGSDSARADREQRTPSSVYAVTAWYVQRLTAMGWSTATDGRYGNMPGIVFLRGHRGRLHLWFETGRVPDATDYRLRLEEVSPGNGTLDTRFTLGDPTPPIVPCVRGEPATITVAGTVTGIGSTTCITEDSPVATPRCSSVSVGMAIGETRLDLLGHPYDSMVITDGHWHGASLAPVSPPQQSVAGGILRLSGSYAGHGARETVSLTAACD